PTDPGTPLRGPRHLRRYRRGLHVDRGGSLLPDPQPAAELRHPRGGHAGIRGRSLGRQSPVGAGGTSVAVAAAIDPAAAHRALLSPSSAPLAEPTGTDKSGGMPGGVRMSCVGVIGMGEMGAAVARTLSERGLRVVSVLGDRSEASRRRAAAACVEAV